jgi:hypothetical protein
MAAAQGVPEFREPKTGQVWTPNNVGHDNGPPPRDPADLAFDPQHQTTCVEGVVVQRPAVVVLGVVPITAGPTVPIVQITDAQLRPVPGKRWEVVLYLNNNSGNAVEPFLSHFHQQWQADRANGRACAPVAGGTRSAWSSKAPGPKSTSTTSSTGLARPTRCWAAASGLRNETFDTQKLYLRRRESLLSPNCLTQMNLNNALAVFLNILAQKLFRLLAPMNGDT